jgi:hypothetical protein
MKDKSILGRIVLLIAWMTTITGLIQIVAPGLFLPVLGIKDNVGASHLFSTVGMFMVIIGGMTAHTMASKHPHQLTLTWSSLQKLGASLAVGIGITRGIFAPIAWIVVLTDASSFLIYFAYVRSLPTDS